MPSLSFDLNAALCALHGESDVNAVYPAIDNPIMAQVIALAPGVHPIVRAVAALAGGPPDLLDTRIIADPALHDAIARLIGTDVAAHILSSWASLASAGWGRPHAAKLIDAVQKRKCNSGVAAALIGPCNTSSALLRSAHDVAFAIRRWGQSTPNEPTAWMHALSAGARDRIIAAVQRDRYEFAHCLPWLPPDSANHMSLDRASLSFAIDAFAEASPTARAQRADILQRLVAQTHTEHLGELTRLACTMRLKEVWDRAHTLILECPDDAYYVVVAAPWDDLDATVRATILECAGQSNIGVAIAAAQGRKIAEHTVFDLASAFFAALDPKVWDALDVDEQRRWIRALRQEHAHLAVRSLGLRPEFLSRAQLNNDLVRAVQRHTRDDDTLHWALLPVALRFLSPDKAHTLITALPSPPDPSAFFVIAGEKNDSSGIVSARAALHTPADLALAVALQSSGKRRESVVDCCTALRLALCGRSWNHLTSILPILDGDAHATIIPDTDALVERLTHPDRRDTLRQALDRLATLPLEASVPTYVALSQSISQDRLEAGKAIADTLHAHGDMFLTLTDALPDDFRTALLPLPGDALRTNALRALARDDPPSAHRLAHAFRRRDWHAATETALTLSAQERGALTPAPDALVERLAHPDRRDALRHALDRLASLPPDVNLLVRFALDMGTMGTNRDSIAAAEDIARALRGHGDVFLSIVNAVADVGLRNALLPLPEGSALADALRDLARDDSLTAHRLTYALRGRDWRTALDALLRAPLHCADAVWQELDDDERSKIVAMVATGRSDADSIVSRYPIAGLALAAVQSNDDDLRNAGAAALAARADVLRAMWNELPQATQQSLREHPAVAVAVADIPAHSRSSIGRSVRVR